MDRNQFSAIAHSEHLFSNPISETKINRIIDFLQLEPHAKVLDIGAGKCELLIRLVEKYDIEATAVELYEGSILEAKKQAQKRISEGKITYIVKDAKQVISEYVDHFDVGICVGSSHALGSLELTLQALKGSVKKGGFILVGEGYWKKKPSQEYLDALGGADESELKKHHENVFMGESMGLVPIWSVVASDDDWDEYEGLYAMSMEKYCYENPNDPDYNIMLNKIRTWKRTYFTWGRDTLGFGLYLFQNQ
ncbi:SAM-dependent methyltransferase [Priestia megaterium]|uniref:SAM-dependent methyltransferase n=1 Tax=Priestia megaterium TaxID=1404 RepID=UPI0024486BDC|nr:methyltransferase domain-containing protein [Priestia megaterium]MDH2364105.1 methyltransferase domain-containing protein [Priestia megaterium]